MPQVREVKTCDRCRNFKRRCDLLKPSCTRCAQAGVRCSFDVHNQVDLGDGITPHNKLSVSSLSAAQFPSFAPASLANGISANGIRTSLPLAPGLGNGSPGTDGDAEEHLHADRGPVIPTRATNILVVGGRVIRKRKRNCVSCLRCHRLKVKCDKELPCGRCKSSGNSRECYYSYNKGHNEGKFPSPTAPTGTNEDENTLMASWQVQHKVRGSSHWRDLMTKVCTHGI